MKKKKYYFAILNWPFLIFCIFLCLKFLTDGIEMFLCVTMISVLFYTLIVHTSVLFDDHVIRFKVGVLMCTVDYNDIKHISEIEWQRPIMVGKGSMNTYAHVFHIKNAKSIGIEHVFFTRDTALEIVETYESMKKRSKELKKCKKKELNEY